MKKVMVFGTFDIFHKGHMDLLKQAKKYGSLIVVVARDETVKKVKGKNPLNNEKERAETVEKSGLPQEVLLGDLKDKYKAIKKYKPEIICLGYDQEFFIDKLRFELDGNNLENTKIIRLKAYKPEIYKSSKLRNKISYKFKEIKKEINKHRNKEKAVILSRFFKTGPGQYGEGDKFLGLIVPIQRKIAKQFVELDFLHISELLKSDYHEFRLIGLLILNYKYEKADIKLRKKVYNFYLKNLKAVNNWDLVDLTAPNILGRYLWESGVDRKLIYRLIGSKKLWERRVGILATFYFIKNKDFKDILKVAEILLKDREDLIQKALGWMLREVGKKDLGELIRFLDKNFKIMPRTMLRYSIERLEPKQKMYYMQK